jgi:hypothetical protein
MLKGCWVTVTPQPTENQIRTLTAGVPEAMPMLAGRLSAINAA